MTAAINTSKRTPEERQEILAIEVSRYAGKGWTPISQTTSQASLIKGKPTNHLLHFFLSLFTLGAWIPVWILVAIFGGQKSKVVTVTEYGQVMTS